MLPSFVLAVCRTVLCPRCAGRPPHCPLLLQHCPQRRPLSLLCRLSTALSSAFTAPSAAPYFVLAVQAVCRTVLRSRSTVCCVVLCPRCAGRPPHCPPLPQHRPLCPPSATAVPGLLRLGTTSTSAPTLVHLTCFLKTVGSVWLSGWLSHGLLKITITVVLCLTWDGPDHLRSNCVSVTTAVSFRLGAITDLTSVCIFFRVAPIHRIWKGVSSE